MAESFYQALGLNATASQDEIKQAYRQLARQYHPDIVQNKLQAQLSAGKINQAEFNQKKQESADRYDLINKAYETLTNPDAKSRYDTMINQMLPQDQLQQYRNQLKLMKQAQTTRKTVNLGAGGKPVINNYGSFAPLFDWYYQHM